MTRRRSIRTALPLAAAFVLAGSLPLTTLAQQAAPSAASPAAEAAFKRADANGDGKLSKEEAARYSEISNKFDELDRDKDGFLSMTEFGAGFAMPR